MTCFAALRSWGKKRVVAIASKLAALNQNTTLTHKIAGEPDIPAIFLGKL